MLNQACGAQGAVSGSSQARQSDLNRRIGRLESIRGNHLRHAVTLATVSGVASTKPRLIEYFDSEVPAIDIVTTKSFQVVPNPGNREPVITEPSIGCFGNSVGLRNPGMAEALRQIKALRLGRCLLNISLSASSIEDFVTLVKAFAPYADSLELNFSCPHAASGYGAAIGSSLEITRSYIKGIRDGIPDLSCPLLAKLTPNVPDIGAIAKAAIDAGADGITAINTAWPEAYTHDGHVVLNNPLGGKGGRSGEWVKDIAREAVSEIRAAIGDRPFLIGEGGVSCGEDAFALIAAGADAVGVGSALGRVRQKDWPAFLEAIKSEASGLASGRGAMPFSGRPSRGFLDADNKMTYVRHKVADIIRHDSSTVVLVLDGSLESQAGQFAFLWLPGIGEKPFSVAANEPLRFIIKNRGPFTAACMKLRIGDDVYVRGLYGNGVEVLESRHSVLIAGGTGEAVLVELARKISKLSANPAENGRKSVAEGSEAKSDGESDIVTYIGVSSRNGAVMESILSEYGPCMAVFDDGVPGRVLESIRIDEPQSSAVYIVGPEAFMAKAAVKVMELGVPAERIMLSMEKNSMCGIGLCGECECGGRLLCQHGTFMGYDFLRKEGAL